MEQVENKESSELQKKTKPKTKNREAKLQRSRKTKKRRRKTDTQKRKQQKQKSKEANATGTCKAWRNCIGVVTWWNVVRIAPGWMLDDVGTCSGGSRRTS